MQSLELTMLTCGVEESARQDRGKRRWGVVSFRLLSVFVLVEWRLLVIGWHIRITHPAPSRQRRNHAELSLRIPSVVVVYFDTIALHVSNDGFVGATPCLYWSARCLQKFGVTVEVSEMLMLLKVTKDLEVRTQTQIKRDGGLCVARKACS